MSNAIEPGPLLDPADRFGLEPPSAPNILSSNYRGRVFSALSPCGRDLIATAFVVGVVAATAIATTIALFPSGLRPYLATGIVAFSSSLAGWSTGKLVKYCNLQDVQFRNSLPCLRKVTKFCHAAGLTALIGSIGYSRAFSPAISSELTTFLAFLGAWSVFQFLWIAETSWFPEYNGGNLNLSGCTFSLPENFTVNGNLNLSGCISLRSLPDNLTVHGNLDLTSCRSLGSLPGNLTVHGNLDLTGCRSLRSLHDNLTVHGNLNMNGCRSLSSVPNWITTLGPRLDGRTRSVDLANTGLSPGIIQGLRIDQAEGMQFNFGFQSYRGFQTTQEAISFWNNLTGSVGPAQYQSIQIPREYQFAFLDFVSRLKETAEYRNIPTRETLACRIISVISKMYENDDFKEAALGYMHTAITSCGDRIIKGLDEIELKALVIQAEKEGNQEALKEIGKGLMHLDALHKTIRNKVMPTLNWVEEIEVVLAFEIQLREKLSLPIQTQRMLFRNCAGVTNKRIETIGNQILTSCEGKLDEYLVAWEPWKRHLRREEAVSYEAIEEGELMDGTDRKCPITLETPEKPIYIQGTNKVFEFEALKKHYIDKGTNPLTNQMFLWKDVRRFEMVA